MNVIRADLERDATGVRPATDGWFVINTRESRWYHTDELGSACVFEGEDEFPVVGINIQSLLPGQPNGMYHAESEQEDFLVLSGECKLIIENTEQQLKQWDFVHCPPETEHIFVGAGTEPCVILMVGSRSRDHSIHYPVSELAAKYGASVLEDTDDPTEAYARFEEGGWEKYREGNLGEHK